MQYAFIAISDADVPRAALPLFQHLVDTYASETNKTVSIWREVTDADLTFRPHPKSNTIRDIFKHQILSERRFFAQFVGIQEPPAETLLPTGDAPSVAAYIERYVDLARLRLPQFAAADETWWTHEMPFFGLNRQRIWTFWRRVLHTCHHRTQVQTCLRLAGRHVPAVYGPSGDVSWDGADPTNSVEAAKRS